MEEIDAQRASARSPQIEIGDISTAGGRLTFMVRDPAQVDAAVEYRRATRPSRSALDRGDWTVNVSSIRTAIVHDADPGRPRRGARQRDEDRPRGRLQSRRSGRHEGSHRHPPGQGPDPRPGSGAPGSGRAQGAARQDRAARIQAGRSHRRPPSRSRRAGRRSEARSCRWRAAAGSPSFAGPWSTATSSIDAKQTFDQNNQPAVSIRFDGRRLARPSPGSPSENVNKPFAIILDDIVLSAPNINEPILGGQAQITGSFTVQTRQRSRRPASLGQAAGRAEGDRGAHGRARSRQGFDREGRHRRHRRHRRASCIFMLLTYGRFGLYANIALILNVLVILGIMALVQRDPDPARHRRLRAHRRRRGRRQRDHQRAHPRGAETRPQGARGRRARL